MRYPRYLNLLGMSVIFSAVVLLIVAFILVVAGVKDILGLPVLSAGDFVAGYLSAGNFSVGIFSAGVFSAGIFAVGIFSFGVFSVGIFSVGIFNIGIFAIGIYTLGMFTYTPRGFTSPEEGQRTEQPLPPTAS